MSELNAIVKVTISRETQAVAVASFGTPAIVSQFASTKTVAEFPRHRYYANLGEMSDDGWTTADKEYLSAQVIFSQNPKPDKVMIGRLDATDTDLTAGLTEIQANTTDWYAWQLIPAGTFEDDIKEAGMWNETQKKLFFYDSGDSDIKNPSSTTDLASFFNLAGYDRTVSNYHPQADDQSPATSIWFSSGWMGEALPYDAGSQTWAYKNLAGVTPYIITSNEQTALFAKKANIYTAIGGVNVTQQGVVASGEYIDVIRGLDWLEARLQEAVYSELVNTRKIGYTDEGVALIENTVRGVLAEGARIGLLVGESIEVTVPKVAEITTADKLERKLPDINFTASLQGAIHKVEINGTIEV